MKYNELYQKLLKQYSDQEIADSMLIPAQLNEPQKTYERKEFVEKRMSMLNDMTEEDRMRADIMRLRFQMEGYLKVEGFAFDKTFGKYLEEYMRILRKDRKEIAADLAVHYTKLSRILNDKEEPNVELSYRLEKHSGQLIQATTWWKLTMKKQVFLISMDEETREREQQKVKGFLKAG
ncbi:MAG: hypothetical protein AAGC85_18150 [Bacteroidota bacterium]